MRQGLLGGKGPALSSAGCQSLQGAHAAGEAHQLCSPVLLRCRGGGEEGGEQGVRTGKGREERWAGGKGSSGHHELLQGNRVCCGAVCQRSAGKPQLTGRRQRSANGSQGCMGGQWGAGGRLGWRQGSPLQLGVLLLRGGMHCQLPNKRLHLAALKGCKGGCSLLSSATGICLAPTGSATGHKANGAACSCKGCKGTDNEGIPGSH